MIKKDDNCYIVDDEEYFSFLKKRKTLTKVIKKSEVKNILFGEVDYKAYISVAKKYNISYDLAKIYVDNALFLKENIDLVSAPNSVKILCEIKEFLTSQNMIYFSSRINILKKRIVLYGNPCDFIDIIPVLNDKKIPFTEEYRQMEEKDIDVKFYSDRPVEVVDTLQYFLNTLKDEKDYHNIEIIAPLKYQKLLKECFHYIGVPFIENKSSLKETDIANIYLSYLKKDEEIPEEGKNYDETDSPYVKEQKNILNEMISNLKVIFPNEEDKKIKLEYFISQLENTKLSNIEEGIEIKNAPSFTEGKTLFILGFSENIIPAVKDSSYLSDELKKKYSYDIKTYEQNEIFEKHLKERIFLAKEVYLSNYIEDFEDLSNVEDKIKNAFPRDEKFHNIFESELKKYISNSAKNCSQQKYFNLKEKRLNKELDKFLYANFELKKRLFGNESNIERYFKNKFDKELDLKSIDSFDNSYKKIAKKCHLKEISYSKISTYFECPFKYYCKNILKIDKNEDRLSTDFGTIVHEAIRRYSLKEINSIADGLVIGPDKNYSAKELYYLNKMIENFKEKIPSLEEFLNSLDNFKINVEDEKKVQLNQDLKYVAKFDLVAYDDDKYVIFDYKTGQDSFSLPLVEENFNMQLPLYLLSCSKLYKDKKAVGAYLVLLGKDKSAAISFDGVSVGENEVQLVLDDYFKKLRKPKEFSNIIDKNDYSAWLEKVENELIEAVKNIEDYNFDIKPKVVKFNTTEKENSCSYCSFENCCMVKREQKKFIIKRFKKEEKQDEE